MRFSVLCWLLMACSGPAVLPEQSVKEGHNAPAPKPERTCDQSDKSPALCAPCTTQCNTIPTGFWCISVLFEAKDSPLTICYSAEATCTKMRNEGFDIGAQVGECQTRESAYCFTMTDTPEQRVHWRCYDSEDDCGTLKQHAMGKNPEMLFGECSLTSPSRVAREQRTAAR